MTTSELGLKEAKERGRRRNVDEELLSLLQKLSAQLDARWRRAPTACCTCPNRCSSRPRSRPRAPRARSTPERGGTLERIRARREPTAAWVPSEVPAAQARPVDRRSSTKVKAPKRGTEDKTPSPRPRAKSQVPLVPPRLKATVEVKPRKRAVPKASSRRTEPIAVEPTVPAPPVAAPVAAPAAPAEGLRARPGSGRRSSRNLLAELYRPSDSPQRPPLHARARSETRVAAPIIDPAPGAGAARGPQAMWEPMTRQGRLSFAPPERASRELNEVARTSFTKDRESSREIFYGSPEKPGDICLNCGRTLTEDSIFCRHCGAKRPDRPVKEVLPPAAVVEPRAPPLGAQEPLNLDSATRQLEQLVQETHQALLRDGIIHGETTGPAPTAGTPSLDAVDKALEELQRGLLEIDHVLAKPIPEAPA
ncbi:unnamed protein product [Durusdinium trenchii]|uniref:Zinc-ribbon domain-containing protein n=1 Tax=Durusdinium trenchii TaxID=1381693 RepID=A0ABP0NL49_9DINO